jgi:sulfur-carrier protein
MIEILYFARLRERLGLDRERLTLPADVGNVAELLSYLRTRGAIWADCLGENETVMAAVNQELARPDAVLGEGDEVAFFPPVTGG